MANFITRLRNVFTDEQEVFLNNDSAGITLDYQNVDWTNKRFAELGKTPSFSLTKVITIVRNEPTVRTALSTLVDKALEGGVHIRPKNSKSNREAVIEFFDDIKGHKMLEELLANLVLYQNAYVEIVRDDSGKAVAWNMLEAVYMRINTKDNGDVLNYYQETGKREGNPMWDPEDIVHFTIDKFNTSTWSEPVLQSLYDTIQIKHFVRSWLKWFFETNQLRPVISIEQANQANVNDLIATLKDMKHFIDKPLITQGKTTITFLQDFAEQGKSVLDVLNWCNDEIYRAMNTPPISVGQPNESGRSDGAEQRGFLYTRVLALQRVVEITMPELFDKSGFKRVHLKFGSLDNKVKKEVFETVQVMRNAQFTEEAIQEYLEAQGVFFETSDILKKPEELDLANKDVGTGNEGMLGNASADAAQSRQRQGADDLSKANQGVQE